MHRKGFTLLELLIVVAIIAILAALAVVNFTEATERALRASDAANLHTIGTALHAYMVDYGKLPPGDQEAGPFASHGSDYAPSSNCPASGGSWCGVPWMLYEKHYLTNSDTLFCPKYLRLYKGGKTISGNYPRYHNFRYAYNSAGLASGGYNGGAGNIMTGTVWLVRDLYLPAKSGMFGSKAPKYPADYAYPWGANKNLELVMFADMAVRLVEGGTNNPAKN